MRYIITTMLLFVMSMGASAVYYDHIENLTKGEVYELSLMKEAIKCSQIEAEHAHSSLYIHSVCQIIYLRTNEVDPDIWQMLPEM